VRLVSLAFSQLRASYPHLTWLVAVSQAEDELFQPVRVQLWSLIVALALTAVAVLALAVWFSIRLAVPPFVDGLHLVEHSGVSRMGDSA